ncbi:hypothetical protein [Micromonospora sp. NPDC050200]|uniref:hypothetical protein n=1 Tax=Micromonospora sp. NPDC050200 TaxID=3155664 RepID=UPI0033F11DED
MQLVAALPDTWLVEIEEQAEGGHHEAEGWQARLVTRYEVSASPVDCWALLEVGAQDGPEQAIAPVAMQWAAAEPGVTPRILLEFAEANAVKFSAESGIREMTRYETVRASNEKAAIEAGRQRRPPSGPSKK